MTKAQERLWLQGFAMATATIYRCHHDWQMVECVMSENGVTFDELQAADVADTDLKQIKAALREAGKSGRALMKKLAPKRRSA